MNRHERRKAKLIQSAITRANKKAVGMVSGRDHPRPKHLRRGLPVAPPRHCEQVGDSEFAVLLEPGKVVHIRRHTRSARSFGLWCMTTRFLSHPNVSSLLRNTSRIPILDLYVNLSTRGLGNGMRECRRRAIEGDPRVDKIITLLVAETQGRA